MGRWGYQNCPGKEGRCDWSTGDYHCGDGKKCWQKNDGSWEACWGHLVKCTGPEEFVTAPECEKGGSGCVGWDKCDNKAPGRCVNGNLECGNGEDCYGYGTGPKNSVCDGKKGKCVDNVFTENSAWIAGCDMSNAAEHCYKDDG